MPVSPSRARLGLLGAALAWTTVLAACATPDWAERPLLEPWLERVSGTATRSGSVAGEEALRPAQRPATRPAALTRPESWVRLGESREREVLMNEASFETWGMLARTWVMLRSKPDTSLSALGIDHELASYTADCSIYQIRVSDSRLYRRDGSVYASRADAPQLRGIENGTIGALVMDELCRSLEARRQPYTPRWPG